MNLLSDVSARYSFSRDINLQCLPPPQSDLSELETTSTTDFEFGTSGSLDQESSSADELFSQGILLPREIREKGTVLTRKQQSITEILEEISEEATKSSSLLESEEKSESKASSIFWSLKRSTSLNLNLDHADSNKKGFLCSLQGLSRSNSTGSVPNHTKKNKDKAMLLQSAGKHPPMPKSSSTSSSSSASSSSSSSTNSSYNNYYQKPQHPKGYYAGPPYSPGRGSRTNSVLNVPPPYISNTNLFGLGSLFRNGKDKKTKK